VQRDGEFGHFAGLGIEPPEVLFAEARIPGDAFLIDSDIMRLDDLARQIVFGDDHARAACSGTRQRLQRVAPGYT